jgi:predicted phosphoribosyltransferase
VFEDREDAGKKLAHALEKYKNKDVLVLAIPRGGVEVGYHVARYLNADFSIIISRKLPFPTDPEAGFGAVAEDGSTFLLSNATQWVSQATIDDTVKKQQKEIARRIAALRNNEPLPEMTGRTVILVDDGIAMGSTMRASIMLCKNREAQKIIVATPVTGRDTAHEIARMVDELVVLEKPLVFYAVAQVYKDWYDVTDREVVEIMKRWKTH